MAQNRWRRYRYLPLVAGGVWILVVWVQIIFEIQRGDFYNHWEFGRRFAAGTFIYEGGLNFVYPPLWAMAHAPLTLVSVRLAKILVYPLALLSIVGLLWVLDQLTRGDLPCAPDRVFWATVLAVLLASPFLARDLPEVGVNTALVALSWLAIYCWREHHEAWGGVCLGLAAALKCTPLLFVAWFALKRQWRMTGWTVLAMVVFTLAPLAFMGPSGYGRSIHHWLVHVVAGINDPDPSRGPLGEEKVENLALRSALARYLMHLPYGHLGRPESSDDPARPHRPPNPYYLQFLDLPPSQAGWVVRLVMVGLLLPLVWGFRHAPQSRADPSFLWEGAAISLLILLYSPVTWKQHGVGALPALYLICRAALSGLPLPRPVLCLVGAYTFLVVVLNRGVVGQDLTKLLDSYRIKTLALLLLLASVLMVWRSLEPRPVAARRPEDRRGR
jgi:alpha-1,2-mannosyltransferase